MKTNCILYKNGKRLFFDSAKEASEFLGVTAHAIHMASFRHGKCLGWRVDKIKGDIPTRALGLRVNGLLTPNKTELNYYAYQAEKGAKA